MDDTKDVMHPAERKLRTALDALKTAAAEAHAAGFRLAPDSFLGRLESVAISQLAAAEPAPAAEGEQKAEPAATVDHAGE